MAKNNKLTVKINDATLTAVLYVVVGVLCCVFRADMLKIMFAIIGALFIIKGVLSLLEKDWVNASINIVIGILVIVFAFTDLIDIILIVFGVLIMLSGIQQLVPALKQKDIMPIVAAAVTITVGILLIVSNWVLVDWIFIVIGVIFIVDGILKLLGK